MAILLNYTRKPISSILYDPKLAYSMHLALKKEDGSFQALNHNSGVLFVKATENEDGSLNAKSLKNPYVFEMQDGVYGVVAVRTEGEGELDEESKGCVVLFTTKDFLEYAEAGLLRLEEEYVEKVYCSKEADGYAVQWCNAQGSWYAASFAELPTDIPEQEWWKNTPVVAEATEAREVEASVVCAKGIPDATEQSSIEKNIEGAVWHNTVVIPEHIAERLCKKLQTPYQVGIEIPEKLVAASREELLQYKAVAYYSDGTVAKKQIDWDLKNVNFSVSGKYEIEGTVHQEHFAFPVAEHRADPCIGRWNGKYYFIATNDADGNHTWYVREADTISELVNAEERLILDSETYEGIGGLLWAPEFHEINGKLYIFHAATPGEFYWEESHVMELKEGGNPSRKEDWLPPKRVVKKDGSYLCEEGKEITLDMTCFEWEGEWYAVWSQRQFLPKDLGAWLYIAKLNPEKPWQLLTEPVVLSKPEYGWANNHTFVDEGPFALMAEDKLYLTFSSAAIDTSYVVGLLTIERGKDLLKRENWKKKNYPILTARSVSGEFGTGHNAYVTDDNGTVWNTYHARPGVEGARSSGIRRVHFDVDGEPVLDLTEESDVKEAFKKVKTTLVVQ